MKMKTALAIACMMSLLLAACSNSSTPQAANSVQLHITNNTNATMYGMEISWHQDGEIKGTQGGVDADGSKMKKGESMVFEFLPEEVDVTKDMLLEVSLITSPNHSTVQLDSKTPVKLTGYGNYNFELISDSGEIQLLKSKE
ncbi:hypothetical protein MHZ92_19790 [Sporosarcina sp. ACRSL]|uniref:hypothetical protein n=1 Tax=Sporosarcina sp. ACRSL TaxID=2918215 RepID=UPI001EF46A85|nr:hypothetical protein [Sporosarcina sp. ACRSL]MCG7346350.1 hypothetical protein [Sporosarcina sp. ACRSL]